MSTRTLGSANSLSTPPARRKLKSPIGNRDLAIGLIQAGYRSDRGQGDASL